MLFGVLFVVFSFALSLDQGVRYFPVALLLGIVLFSFLSEATSELNLLRNTGTQYFQPVCWTVRESCSSVPSRLNLALSLIW